MKLTDLNNPDNITYIMPNSGIVVEASENQGWQETKGRWELWELFNNGLLGLVKSWNKKAVIAVYG